MIFADKNLEFTVEKEQRRKLKIHCSLVYYCLFDKSTKLDMSVTQLYCYKPATLQCHQYTPFYKQ